MGLKSFISIAISTFSITALARTTVTFNALEKWNYRPSDETFWTQIQFDLKNNNLTRLQDLLHLQIKKNKDSLKEAEALNALNIVCKSQNLLVCQFINSFKILTQFPGSDPSYLAIETIETLHKQFDWTHGKLYELISVGSFQQAPTHLIAYLNYIAKNRINEKNAQSYWAFLEIYEDLLRGLEKSNPKNVIQQLQSLMEKPDFPQELQNKYVLALARLYFELGDFNLALKMYQRLDLKEDQQYQIMYERAWAHYWRGEHMVTLGILHTLRSPDYKMNLHPDTYLLEMLSLRSICQFDMAKSTAARFDKLFKKTINQIKTNQNINQNLDLAKVASNDRSLNAYIQILRRIQIELEKIKQSQILTNESKSLIRSQYKEFETQLFKEVSIIYERELDSLSREFISINEQVKLLDYLIGLDKSAQSKEINAISIIDDDQISKKSSFKVLYWPFLGEYWIDETNRYQVQVENLCGEFKR